LSLSKLAQVKAFTRYNLSSQLAHNAGCE
jgi:hypothetical protein